MKRIFSLLVFAIVFLFAFVMFNLIFPLVALAAPPSQSGTPVPPDVLQLIIGAVGLPAFAAAILWGVHKVGVPATYDQIIVYGVSVVFAVLVVTLNFFPQYQQLIVGVVTFIYTMLTTMQQLIPNTLVAVFGNAEQKAALSAKLAR